MQMAYKSYRFSDHVKSMYESGVTIKAIMFRLNLKEETVKKWCGVSSNGLD